MLSLHPLDEAMVKRFVDALLGDSDPAPQWQSWWPSQSGVLLERMRDGDERAANEITLRLAYAAGVQHPTFASSSVGLSLWEARVDRGVGMYLRPPARLFRDLGVDLDIVKAMPIRLDASLGMMGGAYIPAHLIPNVLKLLEYREQRTARRLQDAEIDPVIALPLFQEALAYAAERNLGVFEALDAVGPDGQSVFDGEVIVGNRDRVSKAERKRIEELAEPPREPSLLRRLFGRSHTSTANGDQSSDVQTEDAGKN